jgi:proteasome lid subunit RPN8/RPN11
MHHKADPNRSAFLLCVGCVALGVHHRKGEPDVTVTLSPALRDEIFAQLQQNYPNEGGGFLLGDITGGDIIVRKIAPITNTFATEEQYHRYAMTPADWMRLEDQADAEGLTLVGYYHSHPDSPAIPSEYDRVHALPNFHYLITQVQEGRAVDLRAWKLSEDRSRFDSLSLAIQ